MMTDAPDRTDSRILADQIDSLIDAAQRHMAEGRIVDVSALQGMVERLCDAFTAAPPDEKAAIGRSLERILGDLDALEAAYGAQAQANGTGPDPRQVSDAYGSTKKDG